LTVTSTTDIHTLSPTRRSSDLDGLRDRPDDHKSVSSVHSTHASGHFPAGNLRRTRRYTGGEPSFRHPRHHPLSRRGRARFRREKDRKSTRLNSSHLVISYAVFC